MFTIQIIPDPAYVTLISSKPLPPDPLPVAGQWYTIARCTVAEDAQRQLQTLKQMFPNNTLQLIEQGV